MKWDWRVLILLMMVTVAPARAAASEIVTAADLDCRTGCDAWRQNALWATNTEQPTGTGVIDPFLTIRTRYTEQGMNTDGPTSLDELRTPTSWVRNVQLSDLATTKIDGHDYYTFLLDINEPSATSYLSIEGLQLCTSSSATYYVGIENVGCDDGSGTGTLRWNMDTGGTTQTSGAEWQEPSTTRLLMDYNLNSGSGSGDLFLYVPVEYFADAGENDYLYMWSKFGDGIQGANGYASWDGYEEWAALMRDGDAPPPDQPPGVPEPASLVLLGTGLTALGARWGMKRRAQRQ